MKKKIFIYSFISVILDQISKLLVLNNLNYNESLQLIPNFFNLTLVKNSGASFSILTGQVPFLIIISFIMLFLIIYYIKTKKDITRIEVISYSMVLGGLVGNLIDRMFRSGVIDFLDFNIFGYNFPIFNVADILIVCGIFLLIFLEFRGEDNASR